MPTTDGRVDASGAFTFGSLLGPRLLRVDGLPPTWAIRSVTVDDQDVSDVGVRFSAPAIAARVVRVVITPRTATVNGVVQDESGRPIDHARVRALPCQRGTVAAAVTDRARGRDRR